MSKIISDLINSITSGLLTVLSDHNDRIKHLEDEVGRLLCTQGTEQSTDKQETTPSVINPSHKYLYSFAVLSDLHLSDYSIPDLIRNNYYILARDADDFRNALTFFKSLDLSHICVCGDLSYHSTEPELKLYASIAGISNGHRTSTPIFTCLGNHEVIPGNKGTSSLWLGYPTATNPDIWTKYTGMKSYNRVITINNDNFIFLSINNDATDSDSRFFNAYSDEDIKWLSDFLSSHPYSRNFIFTHVFFPDGSGNYGHIYKYEMTGTPCERLTKLRDTFPNTLWFSGHSHWHWELEGTTNKYCDPSLGLNTHNNFNPNLRTVHIPSCGDPRNSDDNRPQYGDGDTPEFAPYNVQGDDSQFAIVDVYDDSIRIKPYSLEGGKITLLDNFIYELNFNQPALPYTIDHPKSSVDTVIIGYVGDHVDLDAPIKSVTYFDGSTSHGSWTPADNCHFNGSTLYFDRLSASTGDSIYKKLLVHTTSADYVCEIRPRVDMYLTDITGNRAFTFKTGNSYKLHFDRFYEVDAEPLETDAIYILPIGITSSNGTIQFTQTGTFTIVGRYTSSYGYLSECSITVTVN